jgi:hypothetical protein
MSQIESPFSTHSWQHSNRDRDNCVVPIESGEIGDNYVDVDGAAGARESSP